MSEEEFIAKNENIEKNETANQELVETKNEDSAENQITELLQQEVQTEEKFSTESKKVFLIYPPAPIMNREDRCQQPVKDLIVIPPLPPTDLMYMAAVAESLGHSAKIADYSLVERPNEKLELDLKEFKPDYLIINVASTTFENDMSVLIKAKEILPNLVTIVKGAHFMSSNTDYLYKYKQLDLIIVGEVEDTLKEILQGRSYEKIRGLCYRDGFVAKYTGKRPFINNLDKLPFPARHLVDNKLFRRPDNNKVQAVIKVSRGCPHHCFFCLATPVSGSNVRRRSPENIIEEIKECIEKYNIRNFLFWSDVFNFDREWALDLCDKIIESGLDITWSANSRADNVDEEMAYYMYEAGCRLVSIGVESGSQYILDRIGKKTTIDDVRDTVKIFKAMKIKTYNYFVIGLPWDNEETIEQTIDFAIELDSDFVSFYTATPLPGTRFFNYAIEQNMFDQSINWQNAYYNPVVNTHFLSKERILELHKEAIRRFYLRPMYILRMILSIRSFAEVKSYIKAGMSVLLRK